MNNLYWYTSSYKSHIPFSRLTIASKGFFLVEEKVSLPNYKQLIFKKGDSYIQVILYESEIHEETYSEGFDLFVTCVDDQFDWEQLDSPYHDPEIFERHKPPIEAFKYYKINE